MIHTPGFSPPWITVDAVYLHQRLDNFLLARLKGVPKSCLYRLLRQGRVRVNKTRQPPSYRLQSNDIISLPKLSLANTPQIALTPSRALAKQLKDAVLFENHAFLIMDKPVGLPVHGGSGISLGLIESLRQIYPRFPQLSLVHRLDRDTSGCLLIAKQLSSLRALHALFREKMIKKTYLLLAKGKWPNQLHQIDAPLKKNRLSSGERMVNVHPDGQSASTYYLIRKQFKTSCLVEAEPLTGRTHQLRVHASYARHPIAGDAKYGDKVFNQVMAEKGLKRLFLHAYKLQFRCPLTKETIRMCAPLPQTLQAVLNAIS